jgi:hypothetical protein
MADNKKSFILYVDSKSTFEALEDDEAGRLIKHIFRYVSDSNPVAPDKLTQIAFESIKQQLKRDLIKYESICDRNKDNGLKGGRPKKESPDEPKKPSGLLTNPVEPKKPDSVSVNENVNEKDLSGRLSTTKEIFFEKLPGVRLKIDIRPLIEMFKDTQIKKYITVGVKNYTTKGGGKVYSLSLDESSSLIEMYFIKGFKYEEWRPKDTLGRMLTHCINWIGLNLGIDESDSQNNYHLKDNKLFWEAYNNLS